MSYRKLLVRAAVAALALGIAGNAQAAKYLFSFGGTVQNSSIVGGTLFRTTGSNLNGMRLSATITFDDSTPGLVQQYVGDLFRSQLLGFNAANPTSGTLTINGVSHNTLSNGTEVGSVYLENNFPIIPSTDAVAVSSSSSEVTGTIATDYFSRLISFSGGVRNNNTSMISSLNLAGLAGFVYNPLDGGTYNDGFRMSELAFRNNQVIREVTATGEFNIDRFTVSLVGGAIPEAASWAMMIAGFGLVGVTMRRRSAKASYA